MPFQAGEHPRLYFSKDELQKLREQARHGTRAEVLAHYVKWCDRLLDPTGPHYLDFHEFSDPAWRTRAGLGLLRTPILLFSFTYAFTGERRYGEAARDMLLNVIEHKLADAPAMVYGTPYSGWRHFVGHDKFNYAAAICTAYDNCYDLFSPEQRQIFADHALESIELIRNDPNVYMGDMGQMINNRGARGQVGIFGYYSLVLEGDAEVPDAANNIQQSVAATEAYIHVAFDEDGVCFEGPGYAGCLEHFMHYTGALARSGRINLRRSRRWEQYLHHLVQEMRPGGYGLNNLNDCPALCGTVMPSLFLMGTEAGAILPWLTRELDLHPQRVAEREDNMTMVFSGKNALNMLLFWQDDAPVRSPDELGYPKSRLFPHRGIASMRTGWGADDILLSHRCGREMWRLHKQSDQNHLALYALGESFLVDEGYGQTELNRMDNPQVTVNRYFGCADVHNTVLIDGRDQNGNQVTPGWAEGRLIDFEHTADYDTTLGDASEAYGADHAIASAMRRVVFVHNTPQPFAIVIDTARVDDSGASHDFEAMWRTEMGNSISADGSTFVIRGRANDCHGEVLHPADAALSVRNHYNREQLRVGSTGDTLAMVTVLAPVRRGATPPRFTCRETADGDFGIDVTDGPVKHAITAGTRTRGVLHTPTPIRYERIV